MLAKKVITSTAFVISLVSISACVQYPTERSGISDMRPQLSFHFDASNSRLSEARVLVDGMDSGRLGDFVEGRAALRVLSGTHVVRVVSGVDVLLEERVYVGDGVSRALLVK